MVLDVILDSNTHWSQWKSFNWQNGICIKVSKNKREANKEKKRKKRIVGMVCRWFFMSVSKKPAMPACSNQKRAQRIGKEVLLDATVEALQWLGTMVLLPLGSSSWEMRMMMHSIEPDTKPLSPVWSLICFPPDSVLIVQKYFTSEHIFMLLLVVLILPGRLLCCGIGVHTSILHLFVFLLLNTVTNCCS